VVSAVPVGGPQPRHDPTLDTPALQSVLASFGELRGFAEVHERDDPKAALLWESAGYEVAADAVPKQGEGERDGTRVRVSIMALFRVF
jgi:hypothetical protein